VLLLAVAAAFVVAVAPASPGPSGAPPTKPGPLCGGALWRLMTLSDARRTRVDFQPQSTSIADIAQLPPPAKIGPSRTTPFQLHRWTVAAVVDRYRMASNGEIVLILYSIESAQYVDVYLPNPHCLGANTRYRDGIVAARKDFVSRCPAATPQWQLLGATVRLTGIGFWNPSKATRGALPNGAELRPVTNVTIVNGC
jgi:hypothetical protein